MRYSHQEKWGRKASTVRCLRDCDVGQLPRELTRRASVCIFQAVRQRGDQPARRPPGAEPNCIFTRPSSQLCRHVDKNDLDAFAHSVKFVAVESLVLLQNTSNNLDGAGLQSYFDSLIEYFEQLLLDIAL